MPVKDLAVTISARRSERVGMGEYSWRATLTRTKRLVKTALRGTHEKRGPDETL